MTLNIKKVNKVKWPTNVKLPLVAKAVLAALLGIGADGAILNAQLADAVNRLVNNLFGL